MKPYLLAAAILSCSCAPESPSGLSGSERPALAAGGAQANEPQINKLGETILPKTRIPEAYLKSGGNLTGISKINRQLTLLNLNDQIIFSDFSESPLFPWKIENNQKIENQKAVFQDLDSLKKEDLKMKIFSSCSSFDKKEEKIIREKGSSQYQSHFSVLEILPEEALLSEAKDPFSCSFIFTLNDINGNPHQYTLTQQLIPMDLENKDLFLIRASGGQWDGVFDQAANIDDILQTFLMNKGKAPIESVRFICEDWDHKASFSSSNLGAKPVFMNLLSIRDQLPGGTKLCRILSESKNSVNGSTKPFYINFDSFKKQKPLDISEIKLHLIPSFRERDMWNPDKFSGDSNEIYLSGAFRFTGFPEDWRSNFYEPAEIQVKTSCSGNLFENGSFEKTYRLPLNPEFSVMSVSPEELFQLDYSYLYWREKLRQPPHNRYLVQTSEVERFARRSRAAMLGNNCVYEISIKKPEQRDSVFALPKQIRPLIWDSEGYGIEISRELIKNKKYKGDFELPFMNRLIGKNPEHHGDYPDQMALKCGGKRKIRKKRFESLDSLFLSWPFLGAFSSIPYSSIFSHPEAERYSKRKRIARCRLFFYREGMLKYFSKEITVDY